MKKTCSRAIEEDNFENLSRDQKKFITTIFIGDAEWNEPLEQWLFFPLDKFLEMSDSKVHKNWVDLARKYGRLDLVNMPNYSNPEAVKRKSEVELNSADHLKGNILLASAILDLEWYNYFVNQLGIEVDNQILHRTWSETVEYYLGRRKKFSEDVKPLRISLLRNDVKWINAMFEDYGVRSKSLEITRNILENAANDLEE